MRYEQIKTYFDRGNEGLSDLLKDTEDVRDAIEDYTERLMQNAVSTADEYKEALNRLDGFYGFVATIAGVAEVAADTEEANVKLNAKNTALAKGEKPPTDDTAKAMATVSSAEFQRIANLFDKYAKICEKRMMTVQSQLNRIEFEIKSRNSKLNE